MPFVFHCTRTVITMEVVCCDTEELQFKFHVSLVIYCLLSNVLNVGCRLFSATSGSETRGLSHLLNYSMSIVFHSNRTTLTMEVVHYDTEELQFKFHVGLVIYCLLSNILNVICRLLSATSVSETGGLSRSVHLLNYRMSFVFHSNRAALTMEVVRCDTEELQFKFHVNLVIYCLLSNVLNARYRLLSATSGNETG